MPNQPTDPMVIGNEQFLPTATADWKAFCEALKNPPPAFAEIKKLLATGK